MRKFATSILATLASAAAMAQASVEIIAPPYAICPGDRNEYSATAIYNSHDAGNCTYIWDFDNGQIRETDVPLVEYAYPQGGAYMARVTAIFSDGTQATSTSRIQVGVPPSFGGLSSDASPSSLGICLGESVTLSMPISSKAVKYICNASCMEQKPQSIYNSFWLGTINLKCFDGRQVALADDVESISVILSTDSQEDIKIELTTPDGRQLPLKDFGQALQGGQPYGGNGMTIYTLEPSSYASSIIGSPLNGDWIFRIESRGTANEASAQGAEIKIKESILNAHSWTYTQEYDLRRAVWSGKGVSATSQGTAKATPPDDGNTKYTFSISDNLGCLHDTSTYVTVERATFSGADSSIYIGDEISFQNKTSWAAETSWSFGDKTPIASGSAAPHAYYEQDKYTVVMQARSASGCVDVDTQMVSVVPRPLEVKEVNIFTPNGDGINDIFTFFQEDESFLSSGGLTKMPANIRSIKGKIYNIFGQTVYKWDEVEASIFGWDGTWHNNGSRDCPPGTYYYDIVVYGKDGNTLKRTGSIFLYRCKD